MPILHFAPNRASKTSRRTASAAPGFGHSLPHARRRGSVPAVLVTGIFAFVAIAAFAIAPPVFADGFETVLAYLAIAVAYVLQLFLFLFGQLLLVLIAVLIQIAGYNGFVTSYPVANGWAIVRDVTNMFFILVLLVIAFGTILGVDQYSYKNKRLATLLIMAIVVNFSRTICGLLIDFAQVVMLTFVYGFKEAAGGNFADAFQITQLLQARISRGEPDPTEAWKIVVTMGLGLAMTIFSCIIVLILGLALAARIVYLWLLTVLSPLAFFLKAVPGGQAQQYYSKWWGMFTTQVMVGPILAFFLWLSLISVADNRISRDGFPPQPATGEEVEGGVSQAFTQTNMQGFIMSICMLYLAMKMSQEMSAAAAGAGKSIASAAGRAGVRATKAIGKGAADATGLTSAYNKGKEGMLRLGSRIPGVSRPAMQRLAEHRRQQAAGGAWVKDLPPEMQDRIARSRIPDALLSPEKRAEKKEALRNRLEDTAGKVKTDKEREQFFKDRDAFESLGSRTNDSSVAKKIKEIGTQRPDLIVNPNERDPKKRAAQQEQLKSVMQRMGAQQAGQMDPNSMTDEALMHLRPSIAMKAKDFGGSAQIARIEAVGQAEMDAARQRGEQISDEEAFRRGQQRLRQKHLGSLTDEDRLDTLKSMKPEDMKGLSPELLAGAAVAGAAAIPAMQAAGRASDMAGVKATLERIANSLASQPAAVEKLPSAVKDSLRDALVSSNLGAAAAPAILAAGGKFQDAFAGYNPSKGGFDKAEDRDAFRKFLDDRPEGAKQVAAAMDPSKLMERGGVNDVSAELVKRLSAADVASMAKEGKGDSAYAVIAAAEAIGNKFRGSSSKAGQDLAAQADTMIQELRVSGNVGVAGQMTFTGQAAGAVQATIEKALQAPSKAVMAAADKVGETGRKVRSTVDAGVERMKAGARKVKRTAKRL